MKKRLFSLMLTLAVMLTLVPTAFAAKVEPLYGNHYNWGVMDGKRVLLDNYGPICEDFTLTTDYGQHLFLVNRNGDVEIEVDEIWCEVDGEKSDLLYMEEMDWGGFSTWYFQAGEEMEGELCVLSDGTEYRMPFRVVSADSIFYDEKGSMWTPPVITADTSDAASMRSYETYGMPGTEKTVEHRFSDSAWAELETVELRIEDENSDVAASAQIIQRVNGVLQLTGKSLSGVKVSMDASRRGVVFKMTMPTQTVHYDVAMYGYRANRGFDLIPGEDPTQTKEPEVPTVPAAPADPGLGNFKAVNTYTAGQFSDVASAYWGAANIARAYELGLMKGTSAAYFSPEESVTIAETITMAARLHSIYSTGSENFVQSGVWYQTYVDYCKANGILNKDFDYNAPANRSDFAAILAAALPEEALPAINAVKSIPDVEEKSENGAAIYTLYRAGILTGNDAVGTFGPETSINRAAAAAILTRMADPTLRKQITL